MEALRRGTGDGRIGDLGGVTVAPQVEIPRSREIAREITPPERAGRSSTVHHAAPTVGCPANGSSVAGVWMCAWVVCVPAAGRVTKIVSL